MLPVSIGMFVAVALALAVMAVVVLPARRAGREILTPQGEEALSAVRDRVAEVIPGRRSGTH